MGVPRIVLAFVVVLVAAGCSNDSGRAPYLTQPAVSCPAVDALAGQRTAEPLPADFRPVSVVQCTFRLALGRSAASPSADFAWVAAQRSTGPFDDLVRALRLPPQEGDNDSVCPATMVMPALLALTDASGSTVVPAEPGTACRAPRPEIRSALDALIWIEIARAP